eukprot:scaffold9272_cov195-Amphora_coffeaeformis.AAC.4
MPQSLHDSGTMHSDGYNVWLLKTYSPFVATLKPSNAYPLCQIALVLYFNPIELIKVPVWTGVVKTMLSKRILRVDDNRIDLKARRCERILAIHAILARNAKRLQTIISITSGRLV